MKQGAVAFAQGSRKKDSITEHATRRSSKRAYAAQDSREKPRLQGRVQRINHVQQDLRRPLFRASAWPYLIACEDMQRAWPRAKTMEALSSRQPLRTRFGILSAPCCQISRECVLAPAGGFASDAFSATNAALLRTDARMRRGERPPMTLRPHLRTHSRVFWQPPREAPSKPLITKRGGRRTQREGGPEGPPSLGARCPLKRVRAISRGAVPRAWRSA